MQIIYSIIEGSDIRNSINNKYVKPKLSLFLNVSDCTAYKQRKKNEQMNSTSLDEKSTNDEESTDEESTNEESMDKESMDEAETDGIAKI